MWKSCFYPGKRLNYLGSPVKLALQEETADWVADVATKALRNGYYSHLEPGGKSMVEGGFWKPNKEDLQRIREEIALGAVPLREIINPASFKKHFGVL